MYEGYLRYASRGRQPVKAIRYVKRTRPGTFRGRRVGPRAPLATRGFYGNTFGTRRDTKERKVIDVAKTTVACDTTGAVTALNLVAVGTDFTDRIGRKITMKSIQLRALLVPQDSTVVDGLARVILVYDAQSNGAALPAITDILTAATSLSSLNLNNRDRFKVLMDKQFAMGNQDLTAGQAVAGSPSIHQFKKFKRCNLQVIFNTTTAVIAAISSGSLLLVTIGSAAAAAGTNCVFTSRVRFVDA